MRKAHLTLGLIVLASVAVGGCGSGSTSTPATQPTMAATMPAAVTPTPAAVGPAARVVKAPGPKDLTHVLTMDQPYFAGEPAPGAPPSGTLKSGSKVLVVIPGPLGGYSQVISDTGIEAFTMTDGLKPLGK